MITGGDLYSVLSAVVPLYVAMMLAYGSVKWWGILTEQQCMGVNRFVSIFAVPLLSFQFISDNNPYTMNFRFIAADAVSKVGLLLALAIWARYSKAGSLDWMITIFMLGTLPNTLVMGTPLLAAMYGTRNGSLTVQAVVLQCIIWYTLLLVMYEYRAAKILIMEQFPDTAASIVSFKVESDVMSLDGREPVLTEAEFGDDGKLHVTVRRSVSARSPNMMMMQSNAGAVGSNVHSSRSMGVITTSSSKALTPRPSNLTGAEIYSLQSSRNLTPRDSSFNHNEFYSMMMLSAGSAARSPHRQSNFTSSDIYSLHSSRGPTPRTSNFNEESSKEVHAYPKGTMNINSPRFVPSSVFRGGGGGAAGARMHMKGGHEAGMGGVGVIVDGGGSHATSNGDAAGNSHGNNNNGNNNNSNPVAPPLQQQQSSPIVSHSSRIVAINSRPSPRRETRAASPKVDEDARELHMFVWSANASPVSEAGLHVFGGNSPGRNEFDPKEVRMLVHPQSEHASDAAAGLAEARAAAQAYNDYSREDFSFGNRGNFKVENIDEEDEGGPRLDKFGSTSTAELRPKLPQEDDDMKKSMPPTVVMVKLISVMTFRKLIRNPNTYSSLIGVIWSLIACRWDFQMPVILSKSVHILSDAGLGMAMFSLGLFMGLQERILVCGTYLAVVGMVLRFLLGPALFAAASALVGLRGVSLRVAIVQAALPQGIVPFVFAREYNVHPDILSTAVIFGMLIALPITLLYYILLGL